MLVRALIPDPADIRTGRYVDAPVGEPIAPCYWRTQRFRDGYAWRVRRVRICG